MNQFMHEAGVDVVEQEVKQAEVKEVRNYFGLIRQKLSMVGNNDSEFNRLSEILESYERGYIDSDKAKVQADEVFEGKIER